MEGTKSVDSGRWYHVMNVATTSYEGGDGPTQIQTVGVHGEGKAVRVRACVPGGRSRFLLRNGTVTTPLTLGLVVVPCVLHLWWIGKSAVQVCGARAARKLLCGGGGGGMAWAPGEGGGGGRSRNGLLCRALCFV